MPYVRQMWPAAALFRSFPPVWSAWEPFSDCTENAGRIECFIGLKGKEDGAEFC